MTARGQIWTALVLAACGLGACAGPDAADPTGQGTAPIDPGTPGDLGVGSFSMNLTLAGGYRFDKVSYDVSNSNGYHQSGAIDVAASSAVSVVIGGVPFGTNYDLKLTAQDVEHKLAPCMGAAVFDVPNATTVVVPVRLSCHELTPAPAAPVPVPRWAPPMIASLLLTLGMQAVRRRGRA